MIKLDTMKRLAELLKISPLSLLGIGVEYYSRPMGISSGCGSRGDGGPGAADPGADLLPGLVGQLRLGHTLPPGKGLFELAQMMQSLDLQGRRPGRHCSGRIVQQVRGGLIVVQHSLAPGEVEAQRRVTRALREQTLK